MVFLDYSENSTRTVSEQDQFVIRHIINSKGYFRGLELSKPPQGELELAEHGRQHLLESMLPGKTLSLLFMLFIDGFGLYQNMYRSLMGVYIIFAGLNARERSRQANVFPLTLGPHGSDFNDVVEALQSLRLLDQDAQLIINGVPKIVYAFTNAFLGDMP